MFFIIIEEKILQEYKSFETKNDDRRIRKLEIGDWSGIYLNKNRRKFKNISMGD